MKKNFLPAFCVVALFFISNPYPHIHSHGAEQSSKDLTFSKWEATYEVKEYDEDIIASHKEDMDFYLYNPAGVLIVRRRESYENQNPNGEV